MWWATPFFFSTSSWIFLHSKWQVCGNKKAIQQIWIRALKANTLSNQLLGQIKFSCRLHRASNDLMDWKRLSMAASGTLHLLKLPFYKNCFINFENPLSFTLEGEVNQPKIKSRYMHEANKEHGHRWHHFYLTETKTTLAAITAALTKVSSWCSAALGIMKYNV